jgi:hypothetical protein
MGRRPLSYDARPETQEGWSRLGPGLSLFHKVAAPANRRKPKVSDGIGNTCERLIRLAGSVMKTSTTSVDRLQLAALGAAVVDLDPVTRAAIVKHLDSPGRSERINNWARLVQGDLAAAKRRGEFSKAMARVLAIEVVWRLAANKKLPSFLA